MLLYRLIVMCQMFLLSLSASPRVKAPCGNVIGTQIKTRDGNIIDAFLGIPYAKPPIGYLRFKPPQPLEDSVCEILAVNHPPRCLQINEEAVIDGDEDCLYLEVYSPNTSCEARLPVVFFVYGSADMGGAKDYTPEFLLDEKLVYVIIQYRKAFFGFLSTGDSVVPGNMGLKDLRLGLRWVQRNIRSFGGDPEKVTLFGQSYGAAYVNLFMLAASHEGLFRAAISHSGSALDSFSFRPPVEVQEMKAILSNLTECPPDSLGLTECLREKTAVELALLYNYEYLYVKNPPVGFAFASLVGLVGAVLEPSCADDPFLTANPWTLNTSVPWLVGANSKEGNDYFTRAASDPTGLQYRYLNFVFNYGFPLLVNYKNSESDGSEVVRAVRKFYLDDKPISLLTLNQSVDIFSDAIFIYGIHEAMSRADKQKVFCYLFDYLTADESFYLPPDSRFGPGHADELTLFFPNATQTPVNPNLLPPNDEALSKRLIKLWSNFITYLNPTPDECEGVTWEPFSDDHKYLHITPSGDLKMEAGFLKERIEFWETQPYPNKPTHSRTTFF